MGRDRIVARSGGAARRRGRQARLAVVDAANVDGRRKLVLIRRDNLEHLVLIGGPSDVLIEPNIAAGAAPREVPPPRPVPTGDTLRRAVPLGEGNMWPLQPDTLPRVEPAARLEPAQRSEPRPEPRSEPRSEPRPEPRAEPRIDPRAEPRLEPAARNEPPVRPEPRAVPSVPERLIRFIWEDFPRGFALTAFLRHPEARRIGDRRTLLAHLGALTRAQMLFQQTGTRRSEAYALQSLGHV